MEFTFDAELWLWEARKTENWAFVSLPADASDEISALSDGTRRGFGSVRVRVTLGGSTWATSVFPDGKRGCYVLPIKQAVRKAESLDIGRAATVTVALIDLWPSGAARRVSGSAAVDPPGL
ncbi:MAG: DUF1905 domain-containing protein [Actinocrinis sp.]